ncbi:hypothetical protein GCM10019059_37660 [Camelimonas fluminis]|uniref:Lysozyme n=1 Tax=Camelimonas fluminis TaxID=1576911 RepID=A0ABV7UQD9_9HYPH|nr:glycoside hydrolase family protein [Camelimonas fluminis]GHE74614.1 hypothetical protein GCM10019059_37660 [Camelimonas fluminis]
MTRKINADGLAHIKRWEGLRLSAYQDIAGVLTIGYGHTSAAGAPQVKAGMKITEAEAERILQSDLAKFEQRVERLVKVPLSDSQFAALVSFDYNTGALHKSTLLKKLNAGDYAAVPGELAKWVNAGGKRVQGLVNRRASEAGLWAKGEFVSSADVPAKPAAPPVLTKETVSWGAGIAATVGSTISGSGPVQWALAVIMILAFAAGAYFFLRDRLRPA